MTNRISINQALITIGKLAVGYKPGDEMWSEHDQQMYDIALTTLHTDPQQDDLRTLTLRLAKALRKAAPEHELPGKALDYLSRHALACSPLRAESSGFKKVATVAMAGGGRRFTLHNSDAMWALARSGTTSLDLYAITSDRTKCVACEGSPTGSNNPCSACGRKQADSDQANAMPVAVQTSPAAHYSEGICGDGAAILRDGVPMKVHEVVAELNRTASAEVPATVKDSLTAQVPEPAAAVIADMRHFDPFNAANYRLITHWADRLERVQWPAQDVARDAERYRWLRGQMIDFEFDWDGEGNSTLVFEMPKGAQLSGRCDDTIDSAMAALAASKGAEK